MFVFIALTLLDPLFYQSAKEDIVYIGPRRLYDKVASTQSKSWETKNETLIPKGFFLVRRETKQFVVLYHGQSSGIDLIESRAVFLDWLSSQQTLNKTFTIKDAPLSARMAILSQFEYAGLGLQKWTAPESLNDVKFAVLPEVDIGFPQRPEVFRGQYRGILKSSFSLNQKIQNDLRTSPPPKLNLSQEEITRIYEEQNIPTEVGNYVAVISTSPPTPRIGTTMGFEASEILRDLIREYLARTNEAASKLESKMLGAVFDDKPEDVKLGRLKLNDLNDAFKNDIIRTAMTQPHNLAFSDKEELGQFFAGNPDVHIKMHLNFVVSGSGVRLHSYD